MLVFVPMRTIKSATLKTVSRIKTFGNSMFPLLNDGDIVYFKKIAFSDIVINDIIIFKQQHRYITHRVIYKANNYLVTKGDNNLKSDGKVFKKDIIGKLEKVKRGTIEFHPEVFYKLQSAVYLEEIKKVSNILRKNNIDYVFLKGLPLHLHYEQKIPRRLYADCDVLVHKSDFSVVTQMLLKLGYQLVKSELTSSKKNAFAETNFYKKVQNVFVNFDIHIEPVFMMIQADLTKELYSENLMQDMIKNVLTTKKNVVVERTTYPIVNPPLLIVYLCLHLFHHNFRGAFRLFFIDTILKKEQRGKNFWNEFIFIVNMYKLQSFVYPVLLLLNRYGTTQISKKVITAITPANYLQKKVGEQMVSDSFFDDESRLFGGIHRLILVTILSPNNVFQKMTVIANIEVWQLFFTILQKILLSPFKQRKQSMQN